MAFEKLKNRQPMQTPMATPLSHNPDMGGIPQRQPGVLEQVATQAGTAGLTSLAESGLGAAGTAAKTLFGFPTAATVAASAAPAAAAGTAGALGTAAAGAGAAASGAAASGLAAAAMSNPITAPLAIGAMILPKIFGKGK